jgi:carbon monoxide dehydrogenase subunit G
LLAAALAVAAPLPAAATVATGDAQMQGAHVVSWGSVEVSAGLELAFEVLTDYDDMAAFLPGMLASKMVSRDGNTVVVEQSADQGIFLFRQRVDVRLAIVESPPHRLSVQALAGSFKEMDASYLLTRQGDQTVIEYRGRFLPDFHLPPMIGTYAVQRSLERHLGALAAEIERRLAEDRGARVKAQ